jgi:hypothetical protein
VAIGGMTFTVEVRWDGVTWTSLGNDPQDIEVKRGRDDDLAQTTMGTCTVRLFDKTGKYSAEQASGPYYGNIRPLRRVRVKATISAVDYWLFYGFLRRCESDPDYGSHTATLEAVDLFVWLDRINPVIASTGATTTGAAIGFLLDAIDWTDPTMRSLATGDNIPDFSADGSATALSLIGDLLEAERGLFYVRGDGVAVYESRHARSQGARVTSQATIAGTMRAVAPGVDLDTILNRATVTATGGTPQTYTDSASATEFGPSDFSAIDTPYLSTDNQALSLSKYMVSQRKDPLPSARSLVLRAVESTVRLPMLQRELGDRVTVTNAITGMNADYHIEALTHAINTGAMELETRWQLSKRIAGIVPFRIGISTIGGTDVITY